MNDYRRFYIFLMKSFGSNQLVSPLIAYNVVRVHDDYNHLLLRKEKHMNKVIILLFALLFVALTQDAQSTNPVLVGGYTPISANDADLDPIVAFAKEQYLQQNGQELGPLISASRQLVAGFNYKLTFQSNQGYVTIVVFDQPWTHTREVTSTTSTQTPVGGYTPISANDADLDPIVAFAKKQYLQQNGSELGPLISASRQLVAGYNYKLIFQSSQGDVTIVVFDQPWTHTREITSISSAQATA